AKAQNCDSPTIKILVAPSAGGGDRAETISGRACGVEFDQHSVAIFSFVKGVYYPQPYLNNQQTELDATGHFSTQIFLGERYTVILVKKGFPREPAEVFGLPNVGGDVLTLDSAAPGER